MPERINVHIIAGPTASGKSAYALDLALRADGVLINADSIQLYADLPILTARPTAADTARASHKLYGFLQATEQLSAAKWRAAALAEIMQAQSQDQTPIIVGGTGFYLKALLDGLSPIPNVSDTVRTDVMHLQQKIGTPALHDLLQARDPIMAARLHPNDTQRVMRAYEVVLATGESLAHFQALPPERPPDHLHFEIQVLMPARDVLYRRCDVRFQSMLEAGALDEVRAFMAQNQPEDAPVTRALGYKALRDHILGNTTLEEATAQTCLETRHYAKRQTTWFRHQLTRYNPDFVEV